MVSRMTFSASGSGRPLFVPAGISVVRTGPTTRIEFQRLLEDELEHSGIRPSPRARLRPPRLLKVVVAGLLRLIPRTRRSPHSPEGK